MSESLAAEGTSGHLRYKLTTFVVDENLRILAVFPFEEPVGYVERLLETVEALTAPAQTSSNIATRQAPVLFVPDVFDRAFCQFLIQQYERNGGRESGFMQTVGDKLTEVTNPQVKRRKDWVLSDAEILKQVNDLIWRRVKPEIEKAFQFNITNSERYVVGCYDESDRGFFKAHRDNTLPGTGHRRFAMTLNRIPKPTTADTCAFPNMAQRFTVPTLEKPSFFRVPYCMKRCPSPKDDGLLY